MTERGEGAGSGASPSRDEGPSPEDLIEASPCGDLTLAHDGTVQRANRVFRSWSGREPVGRRFQELLAPGGRIFWETHLSPLLHMQGAVQGIAVEVLHDDGRRLPALLAAALVPPADGGSVEQSTIRVIVQDATDRRRYEDELLRARRRERDIGLQLQRSLLAGQLPAAEDLEIDVAYRPSESGMEVGGDWYDAFWLEDGETVALVVGDVVGRGMGAAATMGQLRSAVRAVSATGLGPGPLLDALDRYARRHDVGQMTTLVLALLHLPTGRLDYACAGHLPPVVLEPGSEPQMLWGGRSVPLDAFRGVPPPRAEATHVLVPGAELVLYTDGLVERRAQPLDTGMERLMAVLGDPSRLSGAADLVHVLHDSEQSDDVCVLIARRPAPG